MTAPGDLLVETGGPSPPRRRRPAIVAVAVAGLVVLALTAVVAFRWGSSGAPKPGATASPRPTGEKELSTTEIYEALAPSVVTVEAVGRGESASGTGVIANTAGMILTALHVVKGAATIQVIFAGGTRSAARIRAADPAIDIAALVTAEPPPVLVPAVLGGSGRLSVGDNVVAVGNQLGLTRSTTAGVVSGLDRGAKGTDGVSLRGLIQFDAAVNPGSSGGPLVNTRGETIGIVVALANPTSDATFIGVGFAVPIGAAVAAGGGGRGPQQ